MVIEAIDELQARPWRNGRQVLHLALVVPDIRIYNLLKDRAFVVRPPYNEFEVHLHVVIDDKKNDLDWLIRVALVQSGLVDPDQVNLTYPDQVTLGWPTQETGE